MLSGGSSACRISSDVILNPNNLLKEAIKGQNITETVVILLDANPVDGVSNPGVAAAGRRHY
jgi:hypothetical protein